MFLPPSTPRTGPYGGEPGQAARRNGNSAATSSTRWPIHFAERREGDSKMNLRVQLESALIPFQLRRRAH